jgi:ABC-type bacteriocin/lantibiotic exporter with double-glycine peptidase domain
MFQLAFSLVIRKIYSFVIAAVICLSGEVRGQFCGAECVLKSCEILNSPQPDLESAIKVLNGPEFDRLPSLAELQVYLSELGLYTRLVDIDVLWNLRIRGACVAIHHVNGNHFVVNEGEEGELYDIWWYIDTQRRLHRSEIKEISSSPILIVASKLPDDVACDIDASVFLRIFWNISSIALLIGATVAIVRLAIYR